jgi:hypothetical protein
MIVGYRKSLIMRLIVILLIVYIIHLYPTDNNIKYYIYSDIRLLYNGGSPHPFIYVWKN